MSTPKKYVDYVGMFKAAAFCSLLLIIGTVVMYFTKGINYGVDFRGGVEVQVKFKEKVALSELRDLMNEKKVALSQLQSIGDESQNEFLLKLETDKGDLNAVSTQVSTVLNEKYGENSYEILKNDIVGPKAGAELRTSAFKALAWAILAIMIYLALRFDYKFAPGAIAALIHDVTIIIGAFILTQKEFSLQIVAALLAIIGYSVNDTVVIYDRVREIEVSHPGLSTAETVNRALNETMSRTIITSMTVLGVSLVMLFLGGSVIHDFFFAMTIGVILGVYSTIFIAIPMTVIYEKLVAKKAA
ncbi:protein translocase subunit SecF [Peredibacter starrii]|uniref:Protein-export membrane protein SecF n=1 Tax=Peredibacter starrii TaxID=28202 RepID=A0AAX4HL50_9BACT|nr:protein translocase subunit SecF [Peredibacter starrii]WPU63890.1 protein translocase subunit SecF [Peredibacter starrii]